MPVGSAAEARAEWREQGTLGRRAHLVGATSRMAPVALASPHHEVARLKYAVHRGGFPNTGSFGHGWVAMDMQGISGSPLSNIDAYIYVSICFSAGLMGTAWSWWTCRA